MKTRSFARVGAAVLAVTLGGLSVAACSSEDVDAEDTGTEDTVATDLGESVDEPAESDESDAVESE